jgi:soluble lytic murein transglycosylase-like protein
MAKVIDALVVTLGLDPSGYKKGAAEANAAQAGLKKTAQADATAAQTSTEKSGTNAKKLGAERRKQDTEERKRQRQREREAREAQNTEAKNTEASIGRIKSLALAAAGAVLGFNTIKGAIQAYLGATNQLANLGRFAPTVGTDVKALDVLGDAYKQVGGKAEEAGSDIAKLAHAQFSFAINAPDAMAGWARRLGVNLFDDNGNARDKVQIQQDIAKALQRQTSDLQTQAMYAREMGMSESFIQLYLVKNAAERAKILKDAEATAKASKAAADAAVVEEQARARLKNSVKGVFQNVVGALSPGLAKIENAIADAGQTASPTSADRMLKSLGLTGGNGTAGSANFPKAAPYAASFAKAEKKYNLPSGLLAGVAHRESNFDPNATSKAGARGLMQLLPKYFPNAGQNTDADIDTAAAELSRLIKYYRRMYNQSTALKLALASYNAGQRAVGNAIKQGRALPAETRAYVPAVEKYAGNVAGATAPTASGAAGSSSSSTTTNTTHVETVNIHTTPEDAPRIVANLPAATGSRQNTVNQANSGMR